MRLLAKWLVVAVSFVLASYVIPGIMVDGFFTAVLVAAVFGVLNTFVRPILKILTLPISIVTLGLFAFLINIFMFWVVGYIVPGFVVIGFPAALLGSLFVSVVSWLGDKIIYHD